MKRPSTPRRSVADIAQLRSELITMARGYTRAQALTTANALGLFALLGERPRSLRTLAARLQSSPRGLRALTAALTSMGLLARHGNQLTLTPPARRLLVPGEPEYIGHMLAHQKRLYDLWGQLEQAVVTGRPARRRRRRRADEERFLRAMVEGSKTSIASVLERIDLSDCETALDLGGGFGAYAVAFHQRWPHLQIALFDVPEAIRLARRFQRESPDPVPLTYLTGDARRDDLGGPYDFILISNVLHMFSPPEIVASLRRVRRALSPRGRVLIKDFMLRDDWRGPREAGLFGLNMLVATEGGGVYTHGEYNRMLRQARLQRVRREPFGVGSTLLTARPN